MTIREMTKEDCEAVWELQKTCFTVPWSLDSIRAMFGTPGYLSLIAMEDGILTGYAGIKQVLDEADITNVAVLEDYRKQGIGDALMAQLEQVAMEKEMIGITLEVRISNAPAQHLYHKHGYRAEGLRKNYYPDTHEDAVIMWKYTPFYEGQED